MEDAVASIKGGLTPFPTTVAFSPDALTDAEVAQAARDVLLARVPLQAPAVARVDSTTRAAAHTKSIRFRTDSAFVGFSSALRGLANAQNLDLRETAQLLANVPVSAGDTMNACRERNCSYYFWRPNHAIQRADTDENSCASFTKFPLSSIGMAPGHR
jgi:hypothetical protein